jgi:predicted Co/Zn/Cd cation transporter (cation efflux family)
LLLAAAVVSLQHLAAYADTVIILLVNFIYISSRGAAIANEVRNMLMGAHITTSQPASCQYTEETVQGFL